MDKNTFNTFVVISHCTVINEGHFLLFSCFPSTEIQKENAQKCFENQSIVVNSVLF